MAAGRPTRQDLAGRVYLDLRRAAASQGRPADEFLQLYALEGFLRRMSMSRLRDRLVLKGGMLLAAFDVRRPTRDVDLQAYGDAQDDLDAVFAAVREIAALPAADGLVFDTGRISARPIRDEVIAAGIRVSLTATLARARMPFHVDVSISDPITPPPRLVRVPGVLGGEVTVLGYPMAMVLAEKIATMAERGIANTRWRDFADICLLTRARHVDGGELRQALAGVLAHRGVRPEPLSVLLDGYAAASQERWAAWRRKNQMTGQVPADFGAVVAAVISVADPVLAQL